MGRKLAGISVLAALALALLAGCNGMGTQMAAIIGSISMDPATAPTAWGGLKYHVLVYESNEYVDPVVDPGIDSTVNGLTTVAHLVGTFPGTTSEWYWTTNYILADVPEGVYFIFVWIDFDGNDLYDVGYDAFGFYEANPGGAPITDEPYSPNVVVPATGLLDIDVWCGYPELPAS